MSKVIDVNEGYTNNYLVHGVFILIGSLIFLLISVYLTLLVAAAGICCFLLTNGLEIDGNTRKYRRYGSFFGIKSGTWVSLPSCTEANLILSSERIKLVNMFGIGNQSSKSMTYDILVVPENGEKSILVYEFLKYKNAQKALSVITSALDIPGRDLVLEKIGRRSR